MTSQPDYYSGFVSLHARNNCEAKFVEILESIAADQSCLQLDQAKSCLAVGAGHGLNEINFAKRLMPNLQSFTGVDSDAPSVAALRQNLQRHLPNVNGVVHEARAEEFIRNGNSTGELYDVVLLFRVVHFFNKESRASLYRQLSRDFLSDNGLIVVLWLTRLDQPESFLNISKLLGSTMHMPTSDDIANDFAEAGLSLLDRQYEFRYSQDFSNPDIGAVRCFATSIVGRPVELDEFREAVRKVWPEEKSDNVFMLVQMFKKKAVP